MKKMSRTAESMRVKHRRFSPMYTGFREITTGDLRRRQCLGHVCPSPLFDLKYELTPGVTQITAGGGSGTANDIHFKTIADTRESSNVNRTYSFHCQSATIDNENNRPRNRYISNFQLGVSFSEGIQRVFPK